MVNQLPQGWKEEELGKLVDIFDNLRKPVSSTERLARIKNKDKSLYYVLESIVEQNKDFKNLPVNSDGGFTR